ncbi:MAG TPA: glycosyltransferase family A protein [Dongiaceae bacterium]|nr:glycosyltransferase family A protein [Dongiaceae bacterium]
MMDGGPVVSVVVPAFNAAETISETLQSISRQTYRDLEVVVVDDGSTDGTAALVRRHAANDPRVRLVSQPNGGVASARNAGIRAGTGAFVAFIDADDLWHPTKIAKQVEALLAGGPEMALVYAPFRLLDPAGRVIGSPMKYGVSGWVLHRHFHTNLIGNGSAILIRRHVLEEFGGFDPWLRHAGAEGCEDLLLQLRIAAHYRFGEVREYLVGYRRRPGNMSSKPEQMVRSGILAVRKALAEHRDVPGLSAAAMLSRYEWQRLKVAARRGKLHDAIRHFLRRLAASPGFVAGALWKDAATAAAKLQDAAAEAMLRCLGRRPDEAPPHFYELDPQAGIDRAYQGPMSRAWRRAMELDSAYRPAPRRAGHAGHADLGEAPAAGGFDGPVQMTARLAPFELQELPCGRTYQES